MKLRLCAVAAMCASAALFAEMESATPESQGVSSRAILEWITACETNFNAVGTVGALHGFVVVRHGKVIAEGSWKPFKTLTETHMLYSHSKSFTSTAIGFLVEDGKLDIDERVVDIFPEYVPADADANLREVRVRDLLTMNTGMKKDHSVAAESDWLKAFFRKTFAAKPGMAFKYDSDATYVLAAIVERRSGKKLMEFLKERLFDKIGIEKAWSTTSPQGIACGGWGMNMTTREIARFGQLCLQEGMWNGKRVISPRWIRLATACQTASGWKNIGIKALGEGGDWEQGYGFQFWRCRHDGYRADGAAGQLTLVYPKKDMVVSINAGLNNIQKEIDLVWEHLVSRASDDGAVPEDKAAQDELSARLASLEIPPVKGTLDGLEKYLDVDLAFDPNPRGMKAVKLFKGKDGRLMMRFIARSWPNDIPIGFGKWMGGTVGVDPEEYEALGALIGPQPIRSSGAIEPDGSFHCRMYLTGTTAFYDLRFSMKDGKPEVKGRHWGMRGAPNLHAVPAGQVVGEIPPIAGREETVKYFAENEFGVRPVERPADLSFKVVAENECYGGTAIHRAVEMSCKGPYAPFSFVFHAFEPKKAEKKPGVFVAMNFVTRLKKENFNPAAEEPWASCWPIREVLARGFATVGFTYIDVVDDDPKTCFSSGLFKAFGPKERAPDSWGALSAWAWASSRCVDWLEAEGRFDMSKVAVLGHSRLGKTALWAAATDTRFALACVNDSGCSGAKLNRMTLPFSESIEAITKAFPHWFAPNYLKFAADDGRTMKFDQHNLIAAVAPRKVAVGSGTRDIWAGPEGELAAAALAAPAWEKMGLKGFGHGVRHHYRVGPHNILPEDWGHYMDALAEP